MNGFSFTQHMWQANAALVAGIEALHHIDMTRVAVSYVQARKNVTHGLQATLTPMRFKDGADTEWINGRAHRCERLFDSEGNEILYLLHFYLPRFMEMSYVDKLTTMVHELWHISPAFNGDLRRHPGRCYMHTQSEKEYDAEMHRMVQRWLCFSDDSDTWFLRHDFRELRLLHGPVHGVRIAHPKLKS